MVCGTDSVATCPSCQVRVCNRHMVVEARGVSPLESSRIAPFLPAGQRLLALVHPVGESTVAATPDYAAAFLAGGSRCLTCRRRDGEASLAAIAQAAAEADRDLPGAEAALRDATKTEDIARRIVACDERIAKTVYQGAWVKLVDAEAVPSSAELVTVGEPSRFFGRGPREITRRPAWKVPDGYSWLDEAGNCWDRTLATCFAYAVKPGAPVYYKSRVAEVNVDGVHIVSNDDGSSTRVAAIKKIVAASGLGR